MNSFIVFIFKCRRLIISKIRPEQPTTTCGLLLVKVSISVIGNVGDSVLNDGMVLLVKEKKMQSFFNDLLGRQAKFETFYNPELGHLYVVGFLVPTFLNVIGKKTIGVLPGGPFGVLRGLGISEKEAT